MSKELELLQQLREQFGKCNFNATYYDENTTPIKKEKWSYEDVYFKPLTKALEDFEWLKQHIGFQLLDNLSTSDKIKLLEIIGIEYKQGDWHIKL